MFFGKLGPERKTRLSNFLEHKIFTIIFQLIYAATQQKHEEKVSKLIKFLAFARAIQ